MAAGGCDPVGLQSIFDRDDYRDPDSLEAI